MKHYVSVMMRTLFTAVNEEECQQAESFGLTEIPPQVYDKFKEAQESGFFDDLCRKYLKESTI